MTTMERRPDSRGKVRDIYDAGENLLMVATDRISAFDFILPDEIPFKGEVLNRISAFWFDKFADIVPNHLVSIDPADFPEEFAEYRDYLAGRAMLVKKAQTIPIECIVRGYLTGSGKKTYDENGTVCGIQLPEGLTEASKLPEPLFTPSTKAEIGDHDENISFERCCEIVGEDIATQIRDLSLKIYKAAAEYAATRGIIIADTKFEFGVIDGKVTLIDECLTPDSSRFWPAASYEEGKIQPSYDKQFVRNWLKANWDMTGETPHLPAEVIDGTSERYREAFQMRTTPSAVVSGGPCSLSAWCSLWQCGFRFTSLPAARCPVLFRWSASLCPMSSFWVTLSTTSFVFVPCATCTARRPRVCPRTSSTLLSSARLPRRTRRIPRRSSVCIHTYR